MQIHELTRRRPTNEGIISGIADVAGRAIMQKYGGTTGGTYNMGATASTAQGMATKLSDPLVKQLATSMKGTFKKDVQNLLKTARMPDNTPVTSASQLDDNDVKQALLGEIAKMLGFDYNKLPDMIDPGAGSGTGPEMSKIVQDGITRAVDTITAAEMSPTPANTKLQDQSWLVLSQNIQSAKSMSQFNKLNTGQSATQTPMAQEIKKKADAAGLSPEKLGVTGSIRDPRTIAALQSMGFRP